MGAATFVAHGMFKADNPPDGKILGYPKKLLIGTLTMSNSYATNGDTFDLSSYLSTVDAVIIPGTENNLKYVAGATVATSKVKAFKSVPSHTHDLIVRGGAAVAGTNVTQVLTNILKKEQAADATLAGGTDNIQNSLVEKATEVANTTDLSAVTAVFMAVGKGA